MTRSSRHRPLRPFLPCLLLFASPLLTAADSGATSPPPAPPASTPAAVPADHGAAGAGTPASTAPAGPGPAAPAPASPLRPPPPSPFLGVTIDRPSTFDAHDGLLVTAVVPQATFDHLGVRAGDHLLTANDAPLNSVSDFSAIADHLLVGQLLTMTVRSDTAVRTVSGRVEAVSRPREISEHTQQLSNEIEQLRSAMDQKDHGSLESTLTVLKQLEADLPGMLDTFKQRYPKGKFSVSIHIDIVSDQSAENPQPVPIPTAPKPPTPASPPVAAPPAAPATPPASATAPSTTGPAAAPGATAPPSPAH